jgi:hypothetical protein
MTKAEYQSMIQLAQVRHHALNLTFEQAERVYRYEEERDSAAGKHCFSAWEEWDFERSTFKKILSAEQFELYKIDLKENIIHYEQRLRDEDKEKLNLITFYQEECEYLEKHFLQDFLKKPMLLFGWLGNESAKVEYLRSEFRKFLDDSRKAAIVDHIRFNRGLMPNALDALRLYHRIQSVMPDYGIFKRQMDEPTKAVAQFLRAKIQYLPADIEIYLSAKFEELRLFRQTLSRKYFKPVGGWQVPLEVTSNEEQSENQVMSILLIDRNYLKPKPWSE